MDLSQLLADTKSHYTRHGQMGNEGPYQSNGYTTRQTGASYEQATADNGQMMPLTPGSKASGSVGLGPHAAPSSGPVAKHVKFELLVDEIPQHRARLPMRVNIWPHDTTDSIIVTVKNFYGLYEGKGVSFEDRNGNTLIARYENFEDQMVVYVRVVADEPDASLGRSQTPRGHSRTPRNSVSPRKPHLGPAFQMLPPQPYSRPSSRTARKRSKSPQSARGRRSASASTNPKSRVRPSFKSRGSGSQTNAVEGNGDNVNDYSDSDGAGGSVTSSRRGKNDLVASAEISVENIVEGGRRKRAKFDSSELPLFVPPQVPTTASVSSVSPQRRISGNNGASPFSYSNQHTFSYTHPLPSPQSYGHSDVAYGQGKPMGIPYSAPSAQPSGSRLRNRAAVQHVPTRYPASGPAILPTPDPTVGSVISDEDVALQLMRLGDASNFSSHARTSTSTLDDALSGKAEVASSAEDTDGASDVDDQDLPTLPTYNGMHPDYYSGRYRGHEGALHNPDSGETSGDDYEDNRDGSFKGESDELVPDEHGFIRPKKIRTGSTASSKARNGLPGSKVSKPGKPRAQSSSKSKPKPVGAGKAPISPASLASLSRKPSDASLNFQHQLGVDEEDLSTKPRCQRCRKSKKGCDRQRPCQRCKDAGIGIEGCISEDEGNGRKGRYGRHMGVPVKKTSAESLMSMDSPMAGAPPAYMPSPVAPADKSKKRKR